uniref:Uncharacterized protein n=1 Tax=Atrato Sobemo-like virus 4 TaxID=2689350 RepID=A0A6B9KH01_9VIRU|nr:hypothetical protein [Atrato Sobemo-like virus 4]
MYRLSYLGVVQRMLSPKGGEWYLDPPQILDCNDCVVTAAGRQRLQPNTALAIRDSSVVTGKDNITSDGEFKITQQRGDANQEWLDMDFEANVQLEVGSVVLVSLTISLSMNFPRISLLELSGFQLSGAERLDAPISWLITTGNGEFSTYQSLRVWVEILVKTVKPRLLYNVHLALSPKEYDEDRIIQASVNLDAGSMSMKWG